MALAADRKWSVNQAVRVALDLGLRLLEDPLPSAAGEPARAKLVPSRVGTLSQLPTHPYKPSQGIQGSKCMTCGTVHQ